MVLLDTDFLSLIFRQEPGKLPLDPETKEEIRRPKEKIDFLIETLSREQQKILIPTPVLSELLCLLKDDAPGVLSKLTDTYGFEIAPFDTKAAVEAAMAMNAARTQGSKKGGSAKTWHEIKFDRQIVAIAKSRQVDTVYSNDKDIRKYCDTDSIRVISVWELPDPPPRQEEFFD